jgi:acetylornithine/N-succinyldiaminopimelate aminotransferase
MGERVLKELQAIQARRPAVKSVRGKGLLIGMELDREVRPVLIRCLGAGLLLSNAGEKVIRFAPPLIVSEEEVRAAVGILDTVLREVTA